MHIACVRIANVSVAVLCYVAVEVPMLYIFNVGVALCCYVLLCSASVLFCLPGEGVQPASSYAAVLRGGWVNNKRSGHVRLLMGGGGTVHVNGSLSKFVSNFPVPC